MVSGWLFRVLAVPLQGYRLLIMRDLTHIKREKTKETMVDGPMEPMLPGLYFDFKQLPEAKKWEVGETYYLRVKVRQSSMSQHKNSPGTASFEVLGVEVVDGPKPKPKAKPVRYHEE